MRLKEYGRDPHKRKEYVHQPDLLLVGVDVSKAKHNACMGTQTTMSLAFPILGFSEHLWTFPADTPCKCFLLNGF